MRDNHRFYIPFSTCLIMKITIEKNANLKVRLMNVVDNYGIIIDDTKEDPEL